MQRADFVHQSQNQALFSLLGTTYGGDGITTFALPDLRGRAPLHVGQGSGLSPYVLGQQAGEATHTLNVSEMASHSHSIAADNAPASPQQSPAGAYPAAGNVTLGRSGNFPLDDFSPSLTSPTTLNQGAVTSIGGGGPHNNLQPLLAMNFIIALQGIFPSRNLIAAPHGEQPSLGPNFGRARRGRPVSWTDYSCPLQLRA